MSSERRRLIANWRSPAPVAWGNKPTAGSQTDQLCAGSHEVLCTPEYRVDTHRQHLNQLPRLPHVDHGKPGMRGCTVMTATLHDPDTGSTIAFVKSSRPRPNR
jgi:hypothetical protein